MADREDFRQALVVVLESLAAEQFVIVEYEPRLPGGDPDPLPYSQAARATDSWYLEVVGTGYLPATTWSIDEGALRVRGFAEPDAEHDNWWRTAVQVDTAAGLLIDGLVFGRGCDGDGMFHVSIGTFPPPPDGGEELDSDAAIESSVDLAAAA